MHTMQLLLCKLKEKTNNDIQPTTSNFYYTTTCGCPLTALLDSLQSVPVGTHLVVDGVAL